ncbi:type I glutamate--ammonia ligase [Sporanaerobium hydrogeniformans]|uniref:Type I glutamate--ammonia ligase n=1 Tax=Sporanaerobium hydrogeniformans TaxID=3072179 RepID=A0AC61DCS7_9FIRM|nr:type I glutamate--ammonia ligase [Sporanaerobium hydrogeniformans]PHV70588.1 type I glutamate--ammonia ligase [Sporanaerobium hydrogeniformans]
MSFNKLGALRFVEENDVKFVKLQFCDMFGHMKNISIPSKQLPKAFEEGIAFDASSIDGFGVIEDSELFLFPDPTTLCILPWRPQHARVARLFCDIKTGDGNPFLGDSRYILRRTFERAKNMGYIFNVGAECEFFLFKTDQEGKPTLNPSDRATYFDSAPMDQGENTRREICLTLEQMGFEIESSHHESAYGQHEIDFKYDNVIQSADNILSFKSVVKTIAGRNGLYASFMPKPLSLTSGSGMHINMSLFKDGENIFNTQIGNELPLVAKYFIAGILSHIKEICAVTNPIVNSYKRLSSEFEAPKHIAWSYKNRSCLIRVPYTTKGYNRIELRSPDSTCNPYLTLALILSAGLDGVEKKLELMPALTQNAYTLTEEELKHYTIDLLPQTLNEALHIMQGSEFVKSILGEHLFNNYLVSKTQEWNIYNQTIHDWEVRTYL